MSRRRQSSLQDRGTESAGCRQASRSFTHNLLGKNRYANGPARCFWNAGCPPLSHARVELDSSRRFLGPRVIFGTLFKFMFSSQNRTLLSRHPPPPPPRGCRQLR